jgi:hypothetical protein
MTHAVEHSADLPLSAFMDRDLKPGVRFLLAHLPDLCRRGLPVIEIDAVLKGLYLVVFEHALDLRTVGLGKFVFRMRDQMRKISVIGQKEQPFSIVVEPPDGIHADLDAFQQVLDRGPSFGIGHGRNKTRGLVQHDVRQRLAGVDELAVNLDMVLVRVCLGAELGHDLSVQAHSALGNELLSCSARCHSRG